MAKISDPRLLREAVRARYNNPAAYKATDSWHRLTEAIVREELTRAWASFPMVPGQILLNAGAGGNDFGLSQIMMVINLDIADAGVAQLANPVVASIESIPMANRTVDRILCAGSVINYCDAAVAISEFSRVLRPLGELVIEFESSRSAELMTQRAFGQAIEVAKTFYADIEETVWVYSFEYIKNLLAAAGFRTMRHVPIHILSPWVLLFLRSLPAAAIAARLDHVARHIPFIDRWASNHMLFCQKRIA